MKTNKMTAIAILALGGVMTFSSITNAAETNVPAAPAAEKKAEAAPVPTQADIAKLEADLGLSPELTAKIEALQKDQNARRKVVFQDASLSKADQEAKSKVIVAETREKIKALLTPEQYAKWEKLHEARKAFKAANKK